jgi:histidinol dehydrogenase
VNLDSFTKKITLQSISKQGLEQLGKTIIDMAEAESLQAHANAVKIRLN